MRAKEGGNVLILTRRTGESIMLGDNVSLTVLAIKGGQVRLGFKAPSDLAIHREEIYERIQAERSDIDNGRE